MKAKKIISLLLTLVMTVGILSAFTIVGSAAETLPTNTVIVKLGATATDTSATYNGTEYTGLVYGTTLFAKIQDAINAAKDGDTVLLCAGSYAEAVYISKSLTIKGAQAGVDPNMDEADGAESKKLNPARSLTDAAKETFNNGVWYVGYKAEDTLADAQTVTVNIDGVVFNNKGWIQSQIQNVDKALYLNLKNCIANCTGNAFIFTNKANTQYGDLYSRHITVENTRIENVGTKNYTGMFGKLIADEFVLDNVYVAETNKSVQVTNEWLVSKSENDPKFVVKNSTFHVNAQAIMVDVWLQRNFATVSLANKSSVTIEFDGNTFIGQPTYTAIRPSFEEALTNLKFKVTNNTFVSSQKPALWANQRTKVAPTCYEIDNNTFINCKSDALITNLFVTAKATATKTLCIVDDAAVVPVGDATVDFIENRMDISGGDNTEVATAISEIPATIITTPVAGERLSAVVLPEDAKYTASAVKWYDEKNERVDTAKAGYTYKAMFTLTMLDTASEWFEKDVTALPEGMTAIFAENKRSVDITYVYTVPGEKEPEPITPDDNESVEPGDKDPIKPEDNTSVAPDTAASTEATSAPTTQAPKAEGGCGSAVVGTGIFLVAVSAIGACVIKRKED